MGLLSPECNAPRAVQNIAAQCLNVITEEQDELIRSIIESEDVFVPLLLKLRDTPASGPTEPLLRTVAICGTCLMSAVSGCLVINTKQESIQELRTTSLTTSAFLGIPITPFQTRST